MKNNELPEFGFGPIGKPPDSEEAPAIRIILIVVTGLLGFAARKLVGEAVGSATNDSRAKSFS